MTERKGIADVHHHRETDDLGRGGVRGGLGEMIGALLGNLIEPVTGILDKFIEDKDTKNKLAHEISTMAERHAQ